MPAVLVTRPIATQNSPFLPQRYPKPLPVFIAPYTHRGMARLSGHPGLYTPSKCGHQSHYLSGST